MFMSETYDHDDEEGPLSPLAQYSSLRRVNIPRSPKFSRSDVVAAFASAFEMIGGTPRLALWANENPTEFYRLFGKLLPSATQTEVMVSGSATDIRHLSTQELIERLDAARTIN